MGWEWDMYGDNRINSIGPYDCAEICLNGHLINDTVKQYPGDNMKFCSTCGKPTIQCCPGCGAEIRGSSTEYGNSYEVPSFCTDCGAPYPWLKSRLDTANELFDFLDDISDEDRAILHSNLDDLVSDTPRSQVASLKVKKVLSKVGGGVASAIRDILVDVLSETAKKTMYPNG